MAKQSWKQQMYEQIANSQVQQVMQQKQNEQIQASFDAWQKEQNDLAQIQTNFDAWLKDNPQPVQPIQTAPVQTVKKEEPKQESIPSIADFFKPTTASGRDLNKETAERLREEEARRTKQRRAAINDTLNVLNSSEFKDAAKKGEAQRIVEEKEKAKKTIGGSINQLDLSKYNLPSESGITEQEQKSFDDYTKALEWADPNYRMTKEEQQEARRIASEGKQALAEKYPVENKADFGKLYERMSPEDQAKYRTFDDLALKSDPLAVASVGAADKAVSMLGGALDTVSFFHPEARRAAKDYKELQKKWNETKEATATEEVARSATPLAENVPIIGEITPYGVGQAATQIGAYALTNDFFDQMGAALLGDKLGKLGGFVGNQIGQNAQDIALDTIPRYQELKAQGKSDEEIRDTLLTEGAWNFGGNLTLGMLGEIPGLWKSGIDNLSAKNAADEAFRQNVSEGAEKLSQLANLEDVDNVVRNATRQAEEATQNIDNIAKQMPEVPENVPVRPGTAAPVSPSIENAAEEISKAMDAEEAAKAIEPPKTNKVDIPDEAQEQILSDFEEIYRSMDNMDRAANATGNAKAIEKFKKLQKSVFDYEDKVWNAETLEEVNKAKKAADAARQSFIREMKKIDPNYTGDLTGTKLGQAIYRRGNPKLSDVDTQSMIDDWVKQDVENPNRFVRDAEPDSTNVYRGVNTNNFSIEEVNLKGGKKGYYVAETLDNGVSRNIETGKVYKTREEAKQALEEFKNAPQNKVMAEDIGINNPSKSETITSEPIESGKYEIPDTPENAPTEVRPSGTNNVPPESGDYVSQFRTNNEHRFNLTDEELNNKYFSTDNENFHFMKGDRGADLNNATANLEADYDGTVNKILNKSTDTQFTPQEVDEGFMAWNKELGAARETGDYSKSADIMYRLTRDAHDKGAGLQAYVAWKKNTPAGVVLDATSQARKMAEDQFGKAYVKTLDDLTDNIESICKSGDTLETKIKKLDDLMKEAQSKGYKNGVSGAEQMKELLASGSDISVSNIHDILYEANKVPNLSVASQQQIADIASQMYGKELTSAEKRKFINEINMILSKEKHWSIKDKAIEISHILMLSGMRTHLKNFVANVGMLPQEALARKISAIGQNAYKHFVDPNYKPTQAFKVSKEAKALAEESYVAKGGADAIAEGLADKFTNQIADQIGANYMFGVGKENILSKANRAATNAIPGLKKAEDAAGNLTNKLLTKMGSEGAYDAMDANASLLENYRQFIYGSLSGLEDNPFVKKNYVNRLASYIQAQGFKSLDEIPEEAFDIARAEALKATFKDDNTITELFKKIKNLPVVGELTFPFVKTPANLLARSIDFSPIGLARSLYGAVNKNSRFAKDTVGEVFDEVSKGLGGTATMALGMWLYANGLITGKKSDDPEIANYMSNEGWQEYSISSKGVADFINSKLGTDVDLADNYYDFSFMQPSTTNLIAAEEVWDELMDGKKLTEKDMDSIFNRVKSVAGSYTDALLAQSTMQNVADLFGSQYTDDGVGGNLIQSALEWPTRFTSGALSDIAKLGDDTKREYYSKNKPLETVKNAVASKLPGLSKTLPAKYDVFGEEMTRNKTEGQKWFNTLLNPTSTTQRNDNPLYDYVDSINSQSTSGDYIPDKTLRKIKLNDETEYSLDNKEYSEASRIAGEVRSSFLKDTKSNGLFKSLSADDKANILNNLEKVAVSTAYTSINENARVSEEAQKYMDMYKEGGVDAVVKDYVGKQIVKDTGISSGSNAADAIKEAVAKGNMAEAQRLAKTEKDYLAACKKAGIEKRSEATRKIYEDEGVKGLQQYAKDAKTFESHGVEFNETTRGIYKDYGEKGLDEYKALVNSGLKNKKPMTIYQSAKKDVSKSELPTLEKYAETYKKIDTGSNGEIDQKEFIAYALSQGWSQSQIETQAKIYGDWKTIPVLEKGTIKFKKKK